MKKKQKQEYQPNIKSIKVQPQASSKVPTRKPTTNLKESSLVHRFPQNDEVNKDSNPLSQFQEKHVTAGGWRQRQQASEPRVSKAQITRALRYVEPRSARQDDTVSSSGSQVSATSSSYPHSLSEIMSMYRQDIGSRTCTHEQVIERTKQQLDKMIDYGFDFKYKQWDFSFNEQSYDGDSDSDKSNSDSISSQLNSQRQQFQREKYKSMRRVVYIRLKCEKNKDRHKNVWTSHVGTAQIRFKIIKLRRFLRLFPQFLKSRTVQEQIKGLNNPSILLYQLFVYRMECKQCKAYGESQIYSNQLEALVKNFAFIVAQILQGAPVPIERMVSGRSSNSLFDPRKPHRSQLCEACKLRVCAYKFGANGRGRR